MLKGSTVLLGVTGSIAAYRAAELAGLLVKRGANVHVLMTRNAANFIHPITFETLTSNRCQIDTFDRGFEFQVQHISLAKQADLVLIAPASADVIGKLAHGIADDMLTTTVLACRCPKLLAPAMNTAMLENPIVQGNLETLSGSGWEIIDPAVGHLACGDTGAGRMPEPETLLQYAERELACEKDWEGQKVLVTAGPTQEAIDPVRYITNHSSGKMGYAIARAAMLRGAQVTLISGPTALDPVPFARMVSVVSAREMFEAVTAVSGEQDVLIKAAAVADYRPAAVSGEKIHKKDEELTLELERTDDILQYLGDHRRPGQFLCGFSMETSDMIGNARAKLARKHLDLIAANNVKTAGAGFRGDTNVLTLITRDEEIELPLMSKDEAAMRILDTILRLQGQQAGIPSDNSPS